MFLAVFKLCANKDSWKIFEKEDTLIGVLGANKRGYFYLIFSSFPF